MARSPEGQGRERGRRTDGPRRSCRAMGGRASERVTLRLPLPESIVAIVARGDESGAWQAEVQEQVAALVGAHVPAGARQVRVTLDGEGSQAILSFACDDLD